MLTTWNIKFSPGQISRILELRLSVSVHTLTIHASEQPRRDDASHEIPLRQRSTHAAVHNQLNTIFHGGEEKTRRKSTKNASSSGAHTVHAPLWTPPSPHAASPKKRHNGGKSECLPPDHNNASGLGKTGKQMRLGKDMIESVGMTRTSHNGKSSVEPIGASKSADVEPRKIISDDQHVNKNGINQYCFLAESQSCIIIVQHYRTA